MVSFEAMVFIAFLAALCGLALGVFFICIVLRYFYVESEGIVSVRSGRTEEEGSFRYARVKSPSIFVAQRVPSGSGFSKSTLPRSRTS